MPMSLDRQGFGLEGALARDGCGYCVCRRRDLLDRTATIANEERSDVAIVTEMAGDVGVDAGDTVRQSRNYQGIERAIDGGRCRGRTRLEVIQQVVGLHWTAGFQQHHQRPLPLRGPAQANILAAHLGLLDDRRECGVRQPWAMSVEANVRVGAILRHLARLTRVDCKSTGICNLDTARSVGAH